MNVPSDHPTIVSLEGCALRTVDSEKVLAVRGSMPSDEDVIEVADVFALLGDPNRLRLLIALLEGGEMCVCDLAATAGMSESAASHAVRWLRAHKIVSAPRRQGRMSYYQLDDGHVRLLLDIALTHSQHTVATHPERHEAPDTIGARTASSHGLRAARTSSGSSGRSSGRRRG